MKRCIVDATTGSTRRTVGVLWAIVVATLLMLFTSTTSALRLQNRYAKLSASEPSAASQYTVGFYYASGSAVGSLDLEYCTDPFEDTPCVAPSGIDASAATLESQSGVTGYALVAHTQNKLLLSRPASLVSASTSAEYVFGNIHNPSGEPGTFYIRIHTHASEDGTGAVLDYGAIASTTVTDISISSRVPPILKFCVGVKVSLDCSSSGDNFIDLGELSSSAARVATSEIIAATNAPFGLSISASGTTLSSGINEIHALSTPTLNAPGNSQFGLNLRANSDPEVGAEPVGSGAAFPSANYNNQNRFMYADGDVIATSPVATDMRKFTVSYLVNVSTGQPPGVYSTTISYICVATF